MMNVPRRSSIIRADGKPACIDCGRPVERTRRAGGRGRPQSRCNGCHAKYERNRRAGKIEVLLTPEEYEAVKAIRAAAAAGLQPLGRHRR